jgi:hypothetical protein
MTEIWPAVAETSWVVVLNNRREGHLRGSRTLYEAVLLLEREGAVVVERDLGFADLCLSAAACMCLWTERSFQVRQPFTVETLQAGRQNHS